MDEKVFVTKSAMPPYEEYIEAIKPLWESHWITNMGKYHMELEEKLKGYLKVPNVSLLVNGHMALELTLQAMNFPPGSEIITTPFTFISTTHAIVRNGLYPIFCDVKEKDGTIDENKIEMLITNKTVAILPVHVYGNICNVEVIQKIADKYGLKVIYDAAHAFGESYKGVEIGNYGDAAVFSFHATKIFNTIEGGAVVFQDSTLYDRLYNLKNFGIREEELVVEVGTNAKLNEFSAIMGLCNLKHIEDVIMARKLCYDTYCNLLKNIKGIKIFERNSEGKYNYSYMPILVGDEYKMSRDNLYDYLKRQGIYARKYFYPLTLYQLCYSNDYLNSNVECAKRLANQVLVLPLYDTLPIETVKKIVKIIEYGNV